MRFAGDLANELREELIVGCMGEAAVNALAAACGLAKVHCGQMETMSS